MKQIYIRNGDALILFNQIANESIDLIITDPPLKSRSKKNTEMMLQLNHPTQNNMNFWLVSKFHTLPYLNYSVKGNP